MQTPRIDPAARVASHESRSFLPRFVVFWGLVSAFVPILGVISLAWLAGVRLERGWPLAVATGVTGLISFGFFLIGAQMVHQSVVEVLRDRYREAVRLTPAPTNEPPP